MLAAFTRVFPPVRSFPTAYLEDTIPTPREGDWGFWLSAPIYEWLDFPVSPELETRKGVADGVGAMKGHD